MTPFRWPLLCCRAAALALGALALAVGPGAAQTLAAVKQRGTLVCGVSEGILGFSAQTDQGWAGFDVDLCRALAAAVFGDAGKVRYVPLTANDRFTALQSGAIDVLSRNSTWTMSRETELKLVFPAATYFDGQGFLIRKTVPATSALELDNTRVCVQSGTTTELNLVDYFRANHMRLEPVAFESARDAVSAYEAGRCDVFTSDVSQLHAERIGLAHPDDHVILPDIISKEPLGPAVRQGDEQWASIVKWTIFALIDAEELGVSSTTIDEAVRSAKPDIRRLVGTEGNFGEQAGLTRDWAVRRQTGRKLRRGFRAQRRNRIKARHSARAQSPLDYRRYPLRSTDPLKAAISSDAAAGHEAADVNRVGALADIPYHRLTHGIAGVVNDRLLRHLMPFAFDRHPVMIVGSHVIGSAMPVGDIAARHAVRTAHTLEPGAHVIGHARVLAAVERLRRDGQAGQ